MCFLVFFFFSFEYGNMVMKLPNANTNSKQALPLIFGPARHCFVLNYRFYSKKLFEEMISKTFKTLWECVKTWKDCIKPINKFSKWEMEDKNQIVNSHCHDNIKICLKNNLSNARWLRMSEATNALLLPWQVLRYA